MPRQKESADVMQMPSFSARLQGFPERARVENGYPIDAVMREIGRNDILEDGGASRQYQISWRGRAYLFQREVPSHALQFERAHFVEDNEFRVVGQGFSDRAVSELDRAQRKTKRAAGDRGIDPKAAEAFSLLCFNIHDIERKALSLHESPGRDNPAHRSSFLFPILGAGACQSRFPTSRISEQQNDVHPLAPKKIRVKKKATQRWLLVEDRRIELLTF